MFKAAFIVSLLIVSLAQSAPLSINSGSKIETNLVNEKQSKSTPNLIPVTQQSTTNIPCYPQSFCGLAENFRTTANLNTFREHNCLFFTPCPDHENTETSGQESPINRKNVLKNDGQYIYSVSGVVLSIVKASPSNQSKVMSKVRLNSTASNLFFKGNYLAVFGTENEGQRQSNGSINFGKPLTWINIYNIAIKERPQLLKQYRMSGTYLKSEMVMENGFVYIMSEMSCGVYDPSPWYEVGNVRNNLPLDKIFFYRETFYGNESVGTTANVNILSFSLDNPAITEVSMISILTPSMSYYLHSSQTSIYLVYSEQLAYSVVTRIHRFYLSGSKVIPMADANIADYLVTPLALNQNNGILTVITIGRVGMRQFSNIFCLDQNLVVKDSLLEVAPGSEMVDAKFVDTRLFLVNKDRSNPIYVFDLSNPQDIRSLGELRLADFPNNFEIYDANTLIAFGQTTAGQNQPSRLMVSIFDVTEISRPRRLANYTIPSQYSYLQAKYNYKGFSLSKEKQRMIVPGFYKNFQNDTNGPNSFNGALVFQVKMSPSPSITLKAMVNHLLISADQFTSRFVQKSFLIENMLYTKSNCMLRIHNSQNFKARANVELNCESNSSATLKAVTRTYTPRAPLQLIGGRTGNIPVV